MSASFELVDTPKGRRIVRSVYTGTVTPDDARAAVNHFGPGGDYRGMANVCVIAAGAELPTESRNILTELNSDAWSAVAIVLAEWHLRMVVGLMIKVLNLSDVSIFSDETDALTWIDQKLGQQGPAPLRPAP